MVARSLAQYHAHTFQQACSPHQYALSTRAGSEAVVHATMSLTELEPTSTILFIDGIGTYDTIARASMLQTLSDVEGANTCLPFVRPFFCHHIHIHLARPQRPAPRSSASRRRGTGRSPHASLLNASQQLPAGGNIARFPRRCICGSPATSGAPNSRPFAKPRVPPNAHPTQRRQNTCLESSKPNPPQTSRLWGRTSGSVAMKPLRTNKGSWF